MSSYNLDRMGEQEYGRYGSGRAVEPQGSDSQLESLELENRSAAGKIDLRRLKVKSWDVPDDISSF